MQTSQTMRKSGIIQTQNKIQNELNIHFPPNYNITIDQQDDQKKVELFKQKPRLGQSNPQTFPSIRSDPIDFGDMQMPRYDIDLVINPYKNNMDQVQKELVAYKQKFEQENQNLESLKREHEVLKAQSMIQDTPNLEMIRQEKRMLRSIIPSDTIEHDNFFDYAELHEQNDDEVQIEGLKRT